MGGRQEGMKIKQERVRSANAELPGNIGLGGTNKCRVCNQLGQVACKQ